MAGTKKATLGLFDFLWIICLIQFSIHLFHHWDNYTCSQNFNIWLVIIVCLHFALRFFNYISRAVNNAIFTWIPRIIVIIILAWSLMLSYFMGEYSSEMTNYPECSAFFITTIFTIYGYALSVYVIIEIFYPVQNSSINEDNETLIRSQSDE